MVTHELVEPTSVFASVNPIDPKLAATPVGASPTQSATLPSKRQPPGGDDEQL